MSDSPPAVPALPPMLEQLFAGGDFAWALRMRKADPVAFFAAGEAAGSLLAEKRQILSDHGARHLISLPEAPPLLGRLADQLADWGALDEPLGELDQIAARIEPDLILMDQARRELVAAAVCFPSSWDPWHWLGQPLERIHAVVPGLNAQVGEMVARFLSELRPGKAFQRANWSLTGSPELNYHPALKRAPLDAGATLDQVWLRLEHQLFTAIEGAVVMGIRIQPLPLLSLSGSAPLWRNLLHALESMPEEVARYKNLHRGLPSLIELMRDEGPAA